MTIYIFKTTVNQLVEVEAGSGKEACEIIRRHNYVPISGWQKAFTSYAMPGAAKRVEAGDYVQLV